MDDIDRIERWAEQEMDQLDRHLLKGQMSQEEYDEAVKELNKWVAEEYKNLRNY